MRNKSVRGARNYTVKSFQSTQTTRFTEKTITKGLDDNLESAARCREQKERGETRAFSADLVVRIELGQRLERWLAWVGAANHSNFVMGATNGDASVRLLHDAF